MSSLIVGRGTAIDSPAGFAADGDDLTIRGLIQTNDVTVAKSVRQQLLGYVDNVDEPVLAVTFAGDSTIDGFYEMVKASVDVGVGRLKIGYFPYEIGLRRVEQYSRPLLESVILGALRTNSAGVTNTEVPWIGLPGVANNVVIVNGPAGWGSASAGRTSADGAMNIFASSPIAAIDHDCQVQYSLSPANFYVGAATFEVGSTLRKIVGRQITQDPTNWRLSNGLLRVTPTVSGTSLRLSISVYDGSVWDPAIDFKLNQHVGGEVAGTQPISVAILRNSVEEVVIRIMTDAAGTLDLLLRRGAQMVYGFWSYPVIAGQLGVIPATTVAATTLTGGLRKTTNDGGGNRFVIASPNAVTKDFATGEVYLTANATSFSFAIGFETPGGTSTAGNRGSDLILQYLAADTERLTVVNR